MWVKLGAFSRQDQDVEEIQLSNKIVHEKYRNGLYHDIALLELMRKYQDPGN